MIQNAQLDRVSLSLLNRYMAGEAFIWRTDLFELFVHAFLSESAGQVDSEIFSPSPHTNEHSSCNYIVNLCFVVPHSTIRQRRQTAVCLFPTMFSSRLRYCVFALALCQVSVYGAVHCNHKRSFAESVALNHQSLYVAPEPVPLVEHSAEGNLTFQANTTNVIEVSATAEGLTGTTISSTALVIARDKASAYSAYSGLNDRGIPYQILIVPSSGANLPALSANSTYGNYGLIVVLSEVSYNKGGTIGYQSALTASQWQTLYNYQVQFGVRMVRLDSTPSADTGTTNLGGCCTGEQLVYISDSSAFPQAGLKT